MAITDPRFAYKHNGVFEYPKAEEFTEAQQAVHWLKNEISMDPDVKDWESRLKDNEKYLIGQVLKGFTQTETLVNDYWTGLVPKWFPKPEIIAMATTFGSFEVIHMQSYAMLNEELGLDNFESFMEDETTAAKLENLVMVKDADNSNLVDKAKSLAIFSAFAEGVNLFSSFAILMSFSKRNLLKGVGQIVSFSVRDESLHSTAGCWLFRQLVAEHPEILTDEFKESIYDAAKLSVKLELDFIDKAFELGDIEGLTKDQLKNFIKFRTNVKLLDLNLEGIYNVDEGKVKEMSWFTSLSAGVEFQDFFAGRVTEYAKGQQNWDQKYVFQTK